MSEEKKVVFEVYRNGLGYMSVCTDVPLKDAVEYANFCNPSGTKKGWWLSKDKKFATGQPHPFPCPDHPGRLHLLFEC